MPQCAKCSKKVRVFYGNWKYEESFPEFYSKPLCNSCLNELNRARIKFAGETAIEKLCEHLRQIGLDATVESKEPARTIIGITIATIIGSVRVANRNIDLVEMEMWEETGDATIATIDYC